MTHRRRPWCCQVNPAWWSVRSPRAPWRWTGPRPAGDGIVGYRLGWTTPSGLPQPSWDDVYPTATRPAPDPFVMTNLAPDTDYLMFIEAVTASGLPGARKSIPVHTDAPVIAEPPPTAAVRGHELHRLRHPGAGAQVFFLANNPAADPPRPRRDHDMIACELLPCPCSYSTTRRRRHRCHRASRWPSTARSWARR